jgi:predicted phage terminase large subunit-like protein
MMVAKDPHRFKVLTCGRRWGKTMMCVTIGLKKALEGGHVWWVAPTYAVAGIAWTICKKMIQDIPSTLYEVREADRQVNFKTPGNGFFAFKSAERPENLRGESLDYCVFDEADFIAETTWVDSIRPSLSDRKGGAIFISTPWKEGSWFHKLWLRGQSEQDPELISWKFTSYTNPFIDPKEIDVAKETMATSSFKREFLGEWVGTVGARIKREWVKYYDKLPENLNIAMGVDLAISTKTEADYTAACVLGRDKAGIIYVIAVERAHIGFGETQSFIKRIAEKYKPSTIAIESVMYQEALVQQMQATTKLNIKGVKTTKDKITHFSPLEGRIEHGQVFLSRDLPEYFEDELLHFPIAGWHDDTVDSFSLAFDALGTVKNVILLPSFDVRDDAGWRS